MSFGKAISPGKKYVWEALKYAEEKGVLLVKAAGNDNENIEIHEYFPTNFKSQKDEKPFISNMIVVGASTNDSNALKASFSNYNGKMVDVFAPGQDIYSAVPDGKYEYFPGQQIKEALVKTVNKSSVNANTIGNENFDQISVSGGVIDLYKAAQYAYEHFYQFNKNIKKTIKLKRIKK